MLPTYRRWQRMLTAESNPLYPVPRLMDAEQLARMYRVVAGGHFADEPAVRAGEGQTSKHRTTLASCPHRRTKGCRMLEQEIAAIVEEQRRYFEDAR